MRAAFAMLALLALACGPLGAAEPSPELAGYLGYRGGEGVEGVEADASPSLGLSYGWWVRPDAWLEVLVDRQTLDYAPFDLAVDYLQLGGGYEPSGDGIRPFVTVAAGLSRYGADPGSVDDPIGLSGSIGAGFKVALSPRTSFRLEARGWGVLASGAAAVTCGPGCAFALSGEGFWQLSGRAALVYRPLRRESEPTSSDRSSDPPRHPEGPSLPCPAGR